MIFARRGIISVQQYVGLAIPNVTLQSLALVALELGLESLRLRLGLQREQLVLVRSRSYCALNIELELLLFELAIASFGLRVQKSISRRTVGFPSRIRSLVRIDRFG